MLIVQTLVTIRPELHGEAARILYTAMRIKKIDVPMDIAEAAEEFIAWRMGGDQPKWLESQFPLSGSIAGL